jgi:nucleoside 2-deoxyribosyltransferase
MTLKEFLLQRGCSVDNAGSTREDISLLVISCPNLFEGATLFWRETTMTERQWVGYGSKLISVLANGFRFPDRILYDTISLRETLDKNYRHLTPEEKLDSVLERLNNRMTFSGEKVPAYTPTDNEANKMYFTNAAEWLFYLDACVEKGWLKRSVHANPFYSLTVEGLNRLITISEKSASRYCFIAMAFVEDMFTVLETSIKPALIACGFVPLIVSEEHVESDKTINDAILSGIKKARFTIADFTHHRGGVYFEAGYALGRGQKVIYTCRHDHMDNAHFDLRNNQHIVWKDADDFKSKLINKIEAFIKE